MSKPVTAHAVEPRAAEPAAPVQPTDPTRTPDNTPLPGGGRWAWNDTTATWAPAPAQE